MQAAYLPGNSTVVLKEVEVPVPGHGEVLIKMKSSTIWAAISVLFTENI